MGNVVMWHDCTTSSYWLCLILNRHSSCGFKWLPSWICCGWDLCSRFRSHRVVFSPDGTCSLLLETLPESDIEPDASCGSGTFRGRFHDWSALCCMEHCEPLILQEANLPSRSNVNLAFTASGPVMGYTRHQPHGCQGTDRM